ncbi:MAG TPA: SdrD B-like domain-containing protein, partial [Sphingopyxis sp.]|nr:SdrD B-like domain-containing protein [Sphingopyxis sp.]
GSGGFTITGTGTTAGSGGTISSIESGTDGNAEQGIGIYIEGTNNISLSNMAFTCDFANFGIRGLNVNNFTLRDTTANSASADNGGFGNSNAADEGVISFDNLTGTALFTGNNLSDGHEDIIVIENTSGTLNLTVNDSAANQAVIGRNGEAVGSATGNDGILVTTSGSANLTMTVTGVVFEGWRGDAIQVDARGASTQNLTITNNTFHNGHLDIVSGGGGLSLGLSAGTGAGPNVTYNLSGNSFRGAEGNVINISAIGPSGAMSGTILNNTIGNNNGVHNADQANTGSNAGGSGIFVRIEKDDTGGTLTSAVRIENNDIGDIVNGIGGIHLLANGGAGGTGTARLEATIRNNRIDENGLNIAGGIYADIGGAGGNDAARMGLNIENNNVNMTGSGNAIAALVLGDLTNNAQYYFPGFNGPYTDAGLATFHTSAQPGGEGNTFTVAGFVQQVTTAPTGTFATNANFVLAVPLLAAAPPGGDWEAALREAQREAYEEWLAENATTATGGGRLGSLPGALPMPNDSSGPDVVHIDDPDGNADGAPVGSGSGGAGASPIEDDGILTKAELDWLVEAAIQRWIAAGATEEQVAAMRATEIGVSDLGGLYIGTSSPGLIILDDNAAGHNWFLDTTPDADEEYSLQNGELRADPSTIAGNRVDLLTAIMHELGHQIGLEDEFGAEDNGSLMYGFVNPGERHLPGEEEVAAGTGEAIELTAYALGAVPFGTIQPGTTRQVSWQATYDGPGTNQVVQNVNNNSTVTYNNGGGDIVVNSNVETLGPATALAVDTLSLGNQVFRDVNRNGVFDAGDSGIGGVALTLFADTNNNGVFDAGIDTQLATTTTVSGIGAGAYQFSNLAPGNYIVRVDASNFTGGGALVGLASSPGGADPDNNTNNDSNGGAITAGIVTNPTITLAFNTETANDGTGQLDINDTLDFGFLAPNQAENITGLQGDSVNFTEDGAAVKLDAGNNAAITLVDSTDYNGGSLTVSITANKVAGEDVLGIDTSGTVTITNGNEVRVLGAQIGTLTSAGGAGGGDIVITFNASASSGTVDDVLRSLTYFNSNTVNPSTATRTITYTLVDGDGTVSGGVDTTTRTSTVTITAQDDVGNAGADSASVGENASVNIAVLTNDSDPDGPPLAPAQVNGTAVAEGGSLVLPSGARVTRNADGTLTYDTNGAFGPTPAPGSGASNTPAADSFTYTLAGGGTATVTMTITGIDTDDRLVGNVGGGNLTGGVGNDTYVVIDGADIVIEQPNEGTDTV